MLTKLKIVGIIKSIILRMDEINTRLGEIIQQIVEINTQLDEIICRTEDFPSQPRRP
ncbi:hypothetical protein [Bacillus sp. cl95]|uniref:hypothetical protein n=1 Tax=Bacillus sp. cl95 TaxID=1761761 RepID=UPI001C313893|nr:hypothetical protein [Bacillus sp. cl95]